MIGWKNYTLKNQQIYLLIYNLNFNPWKSVAKMHRPKFITTTALQSPHKVLSNKAAQAETLWQLTNRVLSEEEKKFGVNLQGHCEGSTIEQVENRLSRSLFPKQQHFCKKDFFISWTIVAFMNHEFANKKS